MEHEGDYLFKGPCPECGSSDACAVYTDGNKHCFSCGKTFFKTEEAKEAPPVNPKFITGEYKPLNARKILKKTCQKFGYMVGRGKQIAEYQWKGKPVAQHTRDPQKNFAWIGNVGHLELWGQHL